MFNKLLLFTACLVFGASCKPFENTSKPLINNLPSRFSNSSDSLSTEVLEWKKLFVDPQLISLIECALTSNYDMQLAWQKVNMAKAGVRFTKGIRMPDLSVYAGTGIRKYGDYTIDGVGNYDTQFSTNINQKQQLPNPIPDYTIGFQSNWEIDIWGKLKSEKKAALHRFLATESGKNLVVTNLIAEVAASYFELIALDKELEIVKHNIELQENAVNVVTYQKQVGKANEVAVQMINAQLLDSKSILVLLNQLIVETETKLNFLCGKLPSKIERSELQEIDTLLMNTLKVGIPSDLLKNRPDILEAMHAVEEQNARLFSAKASFYPSLVISSTIGLQSFNALLLSEIPNSLAFNFMGGLTAPVLNRRKLPADLLLAKAEQSSSVINYQRVLTQSFGEVYMALSNIENTRQIQELMKKESEIYVQSISTSTELFKAGRATYLEIYLAQKNALQSQIELVNIIKRQNLALVNLYRSLGGGWK